jgi:hypothetical protein
VYGIPVAKRKAMRGGGKKRDFFLSYGNNGAYNTD